MRTILLALVWFFIAPAVQAQDCRPPSLSHEAFVLVRPYMELRMQQVRAEYTEEGVWRGPSPYASEADAHFLAIFDNRSRAGDEALAYLLNIFVGISKSEKLVCEAIRRGRRLLPAVRSFHDGLPAIGLEPLPQSIRGSGFFALQVESAIRDGARCPYGPQEDPYESTPLPPSPLCP